MKNYFSIPKRFQIIKILTILLILFLAKSNKDEVLRNLQNSAKATSTKNLADYVIDDPEGIKREYKIKCSSHDDPIANRIDLVELEAKRAKVFDLMGNYNSFFKSSEETIRALSDILETKGLDEDILMGKINVFIKIVIPFIIILICALVGWIICCSCCCYDYCIVICKKPESFQDSNSIRMKIIPIVVLIFFGFKSLIPLINSFNNFKYNS